MAHEQSSPTFSAKDVTNKNLELFVRSVLGAVRVTCAIPCSYTIAVSISSISSQSPVSAKVGIYLEQFQLLELETLNKVVKS